MDDGGAAIARDNERAGRGARARGGSAVRATALYTVFRSIQLCKTRIKSVHRSGINPTLGPVEPLRHFRADGRRSAGQITGV